jgi:hypothetical protein
MKARFFVYLLAWFWAFLFVVAASWGSFTTSEFPFPGTRAFSTSEYRIFMAAYVLFAAAWYSTPTLVSHKALAFFRVVSYILALLGFIFLSVPFGIACSFFAGTTHSSYWSAASGQRATEHELGSR